MDPDANLRAQQALLTTDDRSEKRERSDLRRALQAWLSSGGFSPDWKAYPEATKAYRKWVRDSAKFADLAR